MTTIILANRRKDAVDLAALLGLRGRDYRFPYQASSLTGLRPRRVIVHPSFADRRDRHAFNAVLRRSGAKIIQVGPKVLDRLVASAARAAEDSLSTRAAASVLAEPLRLEEEANPLVQVEGLTCSCSPVSGLEPDCLLHGEFS